MTESTSLREDHIPNPRIMKCCNCRKEIPDGARFCRNCEAPQNTTQPDPADLARAMKALDAGQLTSLRELAMAAETGEDFTAGLMCGSCPGCGSDKTEDCENVPDYMSSLLGRCKMCCAVFCVECGAIIEDGKQATFAAAICPNCGSSETDLPAETDDLEDDFEIPDPEVHCFACHATYCYFCGSSLGVDPTVN